MTIEWDSYEPYDPGFAGRLAELPRSEARQAFRRCMETKPARLEMLRDLLKANGIELENSDAAVQELNNWFVAELEADPERPGMLLPVWYSVVHDIALFLGDLLIERHPNLRWDFFTWGKKNVSYQTHAIMGFSTADPKLHANIDPDRIVSQYAHQIVESRGSFPKYESVVIRGTTIDVDAATERFRDDAVETDMFCRWLRTIGKQA